MAIGLSFLGAVVYVLIIRPDVPGDMPVLWLTAIAILLAIRSVIVFRYLRHDPAIVNHRRYVFHFSIVAAMSGFCWGMVPYFFFQETDAYQQMVAIAILVGIIAGGVSTMSSVPYCYRLYVVSLLVPFVINVAMLGGEINIGLAFLGSIFSAVMLLLSRRIHAFLMQTQRSQQREGYRNRVMEMLAHGAALPDVLREIVVGVEAEGNKVICSILLMDAAGERLLSAAAPILPDFYNEAIHGIRIGPDVGCCGTACYLGERVVVSDIQTDPLWINFRDLAEKAGLRSCWSQPIKSSSGKVLGAFAIYHGKPCVPTAQDIARIETAAHIAGLAIDRSNHKEELEQAALVYENSSEAMIVIDAENRVIAVNTAFTQITLIERKDIVGNLLDVASTDARDIETFQAMMNAVASTGKWQGELWACRNGDNRYATRVTVNTIYAVDGAAYRRIILLSDITEQKHADELIWKQANYDSLSGLPNRRLFRDRLELEIRKTQRTGLHVGLLFLDLDRFKEVNDSLGHDAGDRLLIEAAKRICACVRDSDTVARLGGDEFTVILSEIEDVKAIERVAQNVIDSIAEVIEVDDAKVHISVSIGITIFPDDATGVDDLLKNADLAMYAAKNAGRNRFSYFTNATHEAAQDRLQISNDLHRALDGGEFELHYQPIIDMVTLGVSKAEALLRWRHPSRGLIDPVHFIPRAEETGLIIGIGDWVFREAARTAQRFSQMTGGVFQLSVNVSPLQCHTMKDCSQWLSVLDGLGLSGQHVTIEITEGLLLGADPHISDLLLQFRNGGINVAIDDFGTGYSSLSYLKKFDIDFLKIDQSFIHDLATNANSRTLIETIIVMGHKLGLKVIAEGVETQEQSRFLAAAGCDYAQGFLYSLPLTVDALAAKLEAARYGVEEPGAPAYKAQVIGLAKAQR